MRILFILLFSMSLFSGVWAQTGCPGCVVNVPPNLPADTIYLPVLPDGIQGNPYNHDFAFRMPKTTTPVAVLDSTTPPGYTISKIEILSVDGLPPGMSWQPNQMVFDPATQTDGCIKFCGTPVLSDSFMINIKINVTVFVITQVAYLHLPLYIAPKISNTTGFTMLNSIGCGSATVSFHNNIPSGGNAGFEYAWDYGDGTPLFMGEDPPSHTYQTPGTYVVQYHAKVDTAGYILVSATVLSVECSDPIGFGNPDLYLLVFAPGGVKIFDSSPDIPNTQLPHEFPLNIHLGATGNYNLQVWDEDSGIKGGDDPCGNVSFNILSNDTIVSGGFKVALKIIHPVYAVNSKDTVTVYAVPPVPHISAPNGLTKCESVSTPIILNTGAGPARQWYLDGVAIPGATDSTLTVTQDGYYQVRSTTPEGCTVISDSAHVAIYPLPSYPIYTNTNNLLHLTNPAALPATYSLQWYSGSTAIPGATGLKYCATASGTYGLLVTDLTTHCTSFYAATVAFDPNYDCTVASQSPITGRFSMYPNPAHDRVMLDLDGPLTGEARLQVWDLTGRLVLDQLVPAGSERWNMDCAAWQSGVYSVLLRMGDGGYRIGKLEVL